MLALIAGLIVFLGVHSARIAFEPQRAAFIARRGEGAWKGLYSLLSLAGFVLLVWGYGQARLEPVVVWNPPVALRHLSSLLLLAAMILLVAAYVPGNQIKARLGHPMLLGVKTWALAHLIAHGRLAGIVVFAAFLVWAVLAFRAARRRDAAAGVQRAPGRLPMTLLTLAVGAAVWAAFVFKLHSWLIGVSPLGLG
jgi:uncharacterized membrane protein